MWVTETHLRDHPTRFSGHLTYKTEDNYGSFNLFLKYWIIEGIFF